MKRTLANPSGTPAVRSASSLARRPRTLRALTLIVLLLLVAACGEIEWFPEYVRQPTTPNEFRFRNMTGTGFNVVVTSDPITVAGLTAESSPITISGPAGAESKYIINSGSATSAPGNVKNDDRVTVQHKSSDTVLEGATSSTLTIGGVSAIFISSTRSTDFRAILAATTVGAYRQTSGTVFSKDRSSHTVGIKDSLNSGNAEFAIADANGNAGLFRSTPVTVFNLHGTKIFVRNLATNVATPATTTLTIDGVDYEIPLAVQ